MSYTIHNTCSDLNIIQIGLLRLKIVFIFSFLAIQKNYLVDVFNCVFDWISVSYSQMVFFCDHPYPWCTAIFLMHENIFGRWWWYSNFIQTNTYIHIKYIFSLILIPVQPVSQNILANGMAAELEMIDRLTPANHRALHPLLRLTGNCEYLTISPITWEYYDSGKYVLWVIVMESGDN